MNLKLVNVPPEYWANALAVAQKFRAEYPDRRGFMAGVSFLDMTGKKPPFYAYRTKTLVVVRGADDRIEETRIAA
ncbi:hypothetical protein CN090_04375 [Sinorhizobium meliloti]|uniref:hypothetical protein n=1 Tax=Rhizobium meliloti TaxID=382 RepID=UPI000FD6F817|nr:hypothetical protein [Sinorhizobium meliloti]RVO55158.1 hypothetical protein CN090_04375 [Sinorhizobium meliloti]UYE95808.1 hypothetical protein HAAEEKHM_00088 [Sinorhizobium phage AP-16-3]